MTDVEIKNCLQILSVIERIIIDENEYVNDNFGNDKLSSLYIDGRTQYKNEEEQKLIQTWVRKLRGE